MKRTRNFLIVLLLNAISPLRAESELPPDVQAAFSQSTIGENGGFLIRGMDTEAFQSYVKKNWKSIVDNVESLPKAIPRDGFDFPSEKAAFNASVANFAVACECLPPVDYLEFLDRLLVLYENGRISFHSIELCLLGRDIKHNFLEVNWEHPRVKQFCENALRVIPPSKETDSLRECIQVVASGKLADNYMLDRGEDEPMPETLPGIKLQRPWASLIRKYETMTGKKIPPDPDFPDHHVTRPSHKGLREMKEVNTVATSVVAPAKPWWRNPGIVISLVVGVLLVVFWFRSWTRPA